jgi:hypothetical protein
MSTWDLTIEEAKAKVREAMDPYDSEDDYLLLLGFLHRTGTLSIEQIKQNFNSALELT